MTRVGILSLALNNLDCPKPEIRKSDCDQHTCLKTGTNITYKKVDCKCEQRIETFKEACCMLLKSAMRNPQSATVHIFPNERPVS